MDLDENYFTYIYERKFIKFTFGGLRKCVRNLLYIYKKQTSYTRIALTVFWSAMLIIIKNIIGQIKELIVKNTN